MTGTRPGPSAGRTGSLDYCGDLSQTIGLRATISDLGSAADGMIIHDWRTGFRARR